MKRGRILALLGKILGVIEPILNLWSTVLGALMTALLRVPETLPGGNWPFRAVGYIVAFIALSATLFRRNPSKIGYRGWLGQHWRKFTAVLVVFLLAAAVRLAFNYVPNLYAATGPTLLTLRVADMIAVGTLTYVVAVYFPSFFWYVRDWLDGLRGGNGKDDEEGD